MNGIVAPPAPLAGPALPRARIHIDGITGAKCCGWGWRPGEPGAAITFDFRIDGRFAGSVLSTKFRPDLAGASIRAGYASFEFDIPAAYLDGAPHTLQIVAREDSWPGFTTGFRLRRDTSGLSPRFGAGGLIFSGEAWPEPATGVALSKSVISVTEGMNIFDAFRRATPPTIVITVHNAPQAVRACLASVTRHTTIAADILVIDDASTAPGIDDVLDEAAAADGRIRILRNVGNLGYTKTANRGLAETTGDVVLLNSDTLVTPRWLERLMAAAYRRAQIGTVTPLSNNAGAFSIPCDNQANDLTMVYAAAEMGRFVAAATPGWLPSVPTANGFCMFIKRRLIDAIGAFDTEAFPQGYGEENAFCMRARQHGWDHVLEDGTLVLHERSASFGGRAVALREAAQTKIAALYPDYPFQVRRFAASPLMQSVRDELRTAIERLSRTPLQATAPKLTTPRILHILRDIDAKDANQATLDLIHQTGTDFACLVLVASGAQLRLLHANGDILQQTGSWTLNQPVEVFADRQPGYAALLTEILVREHVELVHIMDLAGHAPEAPAIIHALNIPVVLSFHDYYLICPTARLLDESLRSCSGHCTPGPGACATQTPWPGDLPPLKHVMIKAWRDRVRAQLASVDDFVFTGAGAQALLTEHYPELERSSLHVVEDGQGYAEQLILAEPPAQDAAIRILVLGDMAAQDTAACVVQRLHLLDTAGRLDLHFLGNVPEAFQRIGHCHGPCSRDLLQTRIAFIAPSFVLLPPAPPDTDSQTLTDAWACGVPVIGTALGAIGERLRQWGGGWTVDPRDEHAILSLILRIAADAAGYARVAAQARLHNVRSAAEMGQDYRVIYKTRLATRAAAAGKCGMAAGPADQAERARCLRVAVLVDGASDSSLKLAAWRWLRPLRHPGIALAADGMALPAAGLARWSKDPQGRVLIVPAFANDSCAFLLRQATDHGLRIISDAALSPLTDLPGIPPPAGRMAHLGRFAHALIDASEDPLHDHAGLIDERPWLWAAHRRREISVLTPAHARQMRICVVMPPAGTDPEAEGIALAVAEHGRQTGAWRTAFLVDPGHPGSWPEHIVSIATPTGGASDENLCTWIAHALPDGTCALLVPGRRAGWIGPAHSAILGLPCIARRSHPFADDALHVAAERPADWIGFVTSCAATSVPPGRMEAISAASMARWSMRHRAEALLTWLRGG